jgi:hypothetical protein
MAGGAASAGWTAGSGIEVAGMSFWDKVVEFFKEDDSWMRKEPRQFQGKTYTAWDEKADARAAWPNAPCAKCGGIGLKKELYWNRETDTWYHPDCMTE